MSINPAHAAVLCLIPFVFLLELLLVRAIRAAIAPLLREILLFAGLLAVGATLLLIAAVARASTVASEPVIKPVALTTHETPTSLALSAGGATDHSTTSGIFTIFLIGFLILAVAVSQLLAAVLPILIIVLLVPAQDRATLAELVAAMRSAHRWGVLSALRTVRAHRQTADTPKVPAPEPSPPAGTNAK